MPYILQTVLTGSSIATQPESSCPILTLRLETPPLHRRPVPKMRPENAAKYTPPAPPTPPTARRRTHSSASAPAAAPSHSMPPRHRRAAAHSGTGWGAAPGRPCAQTCGLPAPDTRRRGDAARRAKAQIEASSVRWGLGRGCGSRWRGRPRFGAAGACFLRAVSRTFRWVVCGRMRVGRLRDGASCGWSWVRRASMQHADL